MRKCDYCGEEIQSELRRCPYCGSLLGFYKHERDGLQQAASNTEYEEQPVEPDSIEEYSVVINEGYAVDTQPVKTQPVTAQSVSTAVNRMSNGMKVFLTIVSTVIPGLGQLIGIIAAILFMNDQADEDKRSFGTALLIASLIFFVISCIFWFVVLIAAFTSGQQ